MMLLQFYFFFEYETLCARVCLFLILMKLLSTEHILTYSRPRASYAHLLAKQLHPHAKRDTSSNSEITYRARSWHGSGFNKTFCRLPLCCHECRRISILAANTVFLLATLVLDTSRPIQL